MSRLTGQRRLDLAELRAFLAERETRRREARRFGLYPGDPVNMVYVPHVLGPVGIEALGESRTYLDRLRERRAAAERMRKEGLTDSP